MLILRRIIRLYKKLRENIYYKGRLRRLGLCKKVLFVIKFTRILNVEELML